MLKRFFFLLIACFIGFAAISQSTYADSITTYQVSYKKDLHAIIKKDTAYVKFFPIDPTYRVVATVEKLHGQPLFPMATSDGRAKQAIKYAVLKFNLHGNEYILFAYQLSFLISSAEHKNDAESTPHSKPVSCPEMGLHISKLKIRTDGKEIISAAL